MLHEMVHSLIVWGFDFLKEYGYLGVAFLMMLESTVVPIPSEIIIPPAAYWASQGKMSFAGVVLAGTVGSLVGALLMYAVSRGAGRPLLLRFGRFVRLTPDKLERAEAFLARYETGGVFFARLLPVVRHLIGIPAGLVRMKPGPYALMTVLGSALWCSVLTWLGNHVLGDDPKLLDNPDNLLKALKTKSVSLVVAIVVLAVLYVGVMRMTRKNDAAPNPPPAA